MFFPRERRKGSQSALPVNRRRRHPFSSSFELASSLLLQFPRFDGLDTFLFCAAENGRFYCSGSRTTIFLVPDSLFSSFSIKVDQEGEEMELGKKDQFILRRSMRIILKGM